MKWFRQRSTRRLSQQKAARIGVELLETRQAAGLMWSPGPGIDITGIKITDINGLVPTGLIFVKGETVLFSIVGSGEDWDNWLNMQTMQMGSSQDQVNITWSCAGLGSATGTQGSFTVNAVGSYDLFMAADDAGITPTGDSGSRNDAPISFQGQFMAIWVTIGLNSSGAMDSDDPLSFPESPPSRELGRTESVFGAPGLWTKVELTGTVAPSLASIQYGLGTFAWRQTVDYRKCGLATDGSVVGIGQFIGADTESPLPDSQQQSTKNWKVFMIDRPGTADSGSASAGNWQEIVEYRNFTTWVNFNGIRASSDYEWHVTMDRLSNGVYWLWSASAVIAGPGHDPNRPPGTPPVDDGNFNVDCSSQTWGSP